jgi:hypothetical protein
MFGIGPMEAAFVVPMFILWLLPPAASAVFLWMCYRGRFSAPKICPKCGADLRERPVAPL